MRFRALHFTFTSEVSLFLHRGRSVKNGGGFSRASLGNFKKSQRCKTIMHTQPPKILLGMCAFEHIAVTPARG